MDNNSNDDYNNINNQNPNTNMDPTYQDYNFNQTLQNNTINNNYMNKITPLETTQIQTPVNNGYNNSYEEEKPKKKTGLIIIIIVILLLIILGVIFIPKLLKKDVTPHQNNNNNTNNNTNTNTNTFVNSIANKNEKYCTFDGEMVHGMSFEQGVYKYSYGDSFMGSKGYYGRAEDANGNYTWSATYIGAFDGNRTADVISEQPCTFVNNIPVTDMTYMFYKIKANKIDLSKFNTSHVTDMAGMFYGVEVDSLDFSSFDTSNVTNMQDMFMATKIDELNLDYFNTSNVTDMREMFYLTKAKKISVNNFDTSNVLFMEHMFASIDNIEHLDIHTFTSKSIKDEINFTFDNSNFKSIDMSNYDFYSCSTDSCYHKASFNYKVLEKLYVPNQEIADKVNKTYEGEYKADNFKALVKEN